ncbi:MAG: hypothetical protein O6837_16635, partial [Deltaproteobacteria bacterium]|nr:hypothetical protein [Deltaproteobacteria bacterium]
RHIFLFGLSVFPQVSITVDELSHSHCSFPNEEFNQLFSGTTRLEHLRSTWLSITSTWRPSEDGPKPDHLLDVSA